MASGKKHDITLHHLNASRSIRLFWVLEELGLDYKVKVWWRQPNRAAPPELLAITPFGKAPALDLDGEILTESAYIIHRLLAIGPAGDKADVEIVPSNDSVFWSHFAEGSQMTLLQGEIQLQLTAQGYAGQAPAAAGDAVRGYAKWASENVYQPGSQRYLDNIEHWLSTKPPGTYFSGTNQPGLGDFMLLFALHSIGFGSRANGAYTLGERTKALVESWLERPALKRALARLQQEEEGQKAKI